MITKDNTLVNTKHVNNIKQQTALNLEFHTS